MIGFPLVAIGVIWLYSGMAVETDRRGIVLMNSFGGAYCLAGLIAAVNNPWGRGVARIAWYPLLLLIPVGTVLGIMALRILRDDPAEVRSFHEAMGSASPEEVARIVRQEAADRFGIGSDQFDLPLVEGLRFAPGEVIGFIDDLEAEYGFRPVDEVSPSTASVHDLVAAFASQR